MHLLAAMVNLLHNAFMFTHVGSKVRSQAHAHGERVLIDVADRCG